MRLPIKLPATTSYSLPVVISVGLHALLLALVTWGWQASSTEPRVVTPRYIEAKVVKMEASAPEVAPPPPNKTIDVAAQRAERERQAREAEAKRRAEQARREKAERERREREKREQEQRERERAERERREREAAEARQRQLLEDQLTDTLAEEEAMLQAQQQAAEAQSYSAMITERIRQNWSRPPSARSGMKTRLLIDLVPTGRVVDVTILDSSGNDAFDRSAVQAVWKAEQFPELQELDSPTFERFFREFTVLFDPQDLRL